MKVVAFLWVAAVLTLSVAPCSGQGIITTVPGIPSSVSALTLDKQGNLYLLDSGFGRVYKLNTAGVSTTVAGNGTVGYTGDGGPATQAELAPGSASAGLATDAAGNLYITDGDNCVIRKVNTAGIISTVAGTGSCGFSGDGGPATSAQLEYPAGIVVDDAGNLYIADNRNNRVRKVDSAGIITTVAGDGNVVYSGDGVQANTTAVVGPEGLTLDTGGNLYISEGADSRVRKVDPTGVISTVAGQTKKTRGFSGDGGPATQAELKSPIGLAMDASGNLYIADSGNGRIRKVDAAGIITTFAGITGNASSPLGDGGPATSAYLPNPNDVALDPAGNVYIASAGTVRKVTVAPAALSVSPASLSFSYTTGGPDLTPQTVNVTSAIGAIGFTAEASTTSGGNWLSVAPGRGTAPAALSVSVAPAGLGAGVYSGAITLTPDGTGNSPVKFDVTLTVSGANSPAITAGGIVNALGYQTKLAPDTVFVIFGSNLGPSALVAGTANYQTSLGGTSIAFTPAAGGAPVDARIVYTVSSQVAGLLPSSITPGTYAVRVTYNGLISAPQNVTVVARSFGIATSNSAGTGTPQATIGNINGGLSLTRFTSGATAFGGYNWTLTPAHPGDTVVLWGTGGGADPANDTGGTSGDQTAAGNFQVIVGARQITPVYAGASSGYPGLWQVNFVLPADIPVDCFATAQVSAGGELSNTVDIPIAAAGQSSCTDPSMPEAVLSKLDAGSNITVAGFTVAKIDSSATQEISSGEVSSFTPSAWIILNSGPLFGTCRVYDRSYPVAGKDPASPSGSLDAGAKLSLAGPGLPAGFALGESNLGSFGPVYDGSLPAGTPAGGTYTLTGTGGTQVGAFSVSATFPASFTVTNWDSITLIDRSKPLTLSWTGSGFDQVAIGISTAVVNGAVQHVASITCTVPGAPGSFSVPAGALAYLLPVGASGTSFGALSVQATGAGRFTADLAGGGQIDIGVFSANLGVAKSLTVQ